jgi:hypothetical protein
MLYSYLSGLLRIMGLIVHCVSFSISLNVLCVYVNSFLGALSAYDPRRILKF